MAFRFKHFSIEDENCSMKVGTDAVLLGAWADLTIAKRVLEVGTGSGIIALMLAQRFPHLQIDAIEIDESSAMQAKQNILNNQRDKINIIHGNFREFYKHENQKYEVIISNPPYFENSLKPEMVSRRISKHTGNLSHRELLFGAGKLGNRLLLILPWLSNNNFRELALLEQFYVQNSMVVTPKPGKQPVRIMLDLKKEKPSKEASSSIYIRDASGNFTNEYKELTKDFYLDF